MEATLVGRLEVAVECLEATVVSSATLPKLTLGLLLSDDGISFMLRFFPIVFKSHSRRGHKVGLTEYEKMRAANISRNNQRLQSLGIPALVSILNNTSAKGKPSACADSCLDKEDLDNLKMQVEELEAKNAKLQEEIDILKKTSKEAKKASFLSL
ncbi:hypothetical protein ACP4OV_013012 [Aristida adscensionis]